MNSNATVPFSFLLLEILRMNPTSRKSAATWRLCLGGAMALSASCKEVEDSYIPPSSSPTAGSAGETAVDTNGEAGSGGSNSGGAGGATDSLPPVDDEEVLFNGFAEAADAQGWTVSYATPASLIASVEAPAPEADAGTSAPTSPSADAGVAPAGDAGVPSDAVPAAEGEPDPRFAFTAHDSEVGDPVAGSLKINVPFSPDDVPPPEDPLYKLGVELTLDPPQDWSAKRGIQMVARLNDGVFSSANAPPQIKIYIRTGPDGHYSNVGFNLEEDARGTWRPYIFAFRSPGYEEEPQGTSDLTDVRTLGIEIAGGEATAVLPGTINVDSFLLVD